MVLCIMAAGLGTRFGGQKQTCPVDDDGNFLIDYSVFDAICAGFDEVVIIVSRQNKEEISETIGRRISKFVKVSYAVQEFGRLIDVYQSLEKRKKPLGTGHALLCAKDVINSDFAVINADDFYGREAFEKIFKFLSSCHLGSEFCMVAFEAKNTISKNGAVKRGIVDKCGGFLKSICECEVELVNEKIKINPFGDCNFSISAQPLVSMNMFGFTPKIFEMLESEFVAFLESANLECDEFFLPSVLEKNIKENLCRVSVLRTSKKWFGLTYREDLAETYNSLKNLKKSGKYPLTLWGKR